MNKREVPREQSQPRPNRRAFKGASASALVLTLIATSLPTAAKAEWQDKSGDLPGIASKGAVIGVAVAGAAAVGLLLYFKMRHKGSPRVKLESPAVRFDDVTPGQTAQRSVPVRNPMPEAVTVRSVTLEDPTSMFALSDPRPVPFTLAPGEQYEIPVTLSARNDGGTARLRIVASTPESSKDAVAVVKVSYGHKKTKLGKLVPSTHREPSS